MRPQQGPFLKEPSLTETAQLARRQTGEAVYVLLRVENKSQDKTEITHRKNQTIINPQKGRENERGFKKMESGVCRVPKEAKRNQINETPEK